MRGSLIFVVLFLAALGAIALTPTAASAWWGYGYYPYYSYYPTYSYGYYPAYYAGPAPWYYPYYSYSYYPVYYGYYGGYWCY